MIPDHYFYNLEDLKEYVNIITNSLKTDKTNIRLLTNKCTL